MNLGELLVILLVAIAVFSPKHLPEIARTASRAIRTVRRLTTEIKSTFDEVIQHEELAEKEKRALEADQHYKKNQSEG